MFDNEVNKLFAPLSCNSRASRKMFSYRHIASSLCLNSASPVPAPWISTQPLRNSSQPQWILAAWTSGHPSLRAPVITAWRLL